MPKKISEVSTRENLVSGSIWFPATLLSPLLSPLSPTVIPRTDNPRLGADRANHFPIRHWKNVSIELEYITVVGGGGNPGRIHVGWSPRIIFLVHSYPATESIILLTRSCTRRAPILVQEGNISSYRQVAITVPGRYSLAWQDGLFMSEADLQARKRSFHSRPRRKRGCPSCPRQEPCYLIVRDAKTGCIEWVISSPTAFLSGEQCSRVEGSKADAINWRSLKVKRGKLETLTRTLLEMVHIIVKVLDSSWVKNRT